MLIFLGVVVLVVVLSFFFFSLPFLPYPLPGRQFPQIEFLLCQCNPGAPTKNQQARVLRCLIAGD